MAVAALKAPARNGLLEPSWSNWPLALLGAVVIMPLAIWLLPGDVAFWVSLAAAALVAATAVVNAYNRRHHGALLVAPAVALLFLMNIFPLLWSLAAGSAAVLLLGIAEDWSVLLAGVVGFGLLVWKRQQPPATVAPTR